MLKRRSSEIGEKAHPVLIDILDEGRLSVVARDCDIVVNAAGPEWKVLLPALRASINAGTHYCDLGADGPTAKRQFELDSVAKEQDVVAVAGMGYDPGVDNLLAVHSRSKFDVVREMEFCYALALPDDILRDAVDTLLKNGRVDSSWQPVISIIAKPIRVYEEGSWVEVDPLEHGVEVRSPTGLTATAYPASLPEQVTLPRYFPEIPTMSFLFSITPRGISELAYVEAERISRERVSVEEATRSFLMAVGGDPERYLKGSGSGWEMWLTVTGLKDGRLGRYTCWPVRIASTSVSLSVAAIRILRGEVKVRGVVPPEACFEPISFFEEMGRYMPPEDQDKPLFGESMVWSQ